MSNPYLTDYSAGLASGHPASQPARSPSRASFPKDQFGSPQVRYLGHWSELLADLEILGPVWIETERPGLRVVHRRRLGGLRTQGLIGYLDSAEYRVRLLLDRCVALRAFQDEQGLAIEDSNAQPQVSLRLDSGAHPLPLRLFLSSLGARHRRVVPAPDQRQQVQVAPLEQHVVGRLQRDCQSLDPGLAFYDVGELSGRLRLQPRGLRRCAEVGAELASVAIDPSLVPCALETLADQAYPLSVTSGSSAWVSRAVQSFYGHAYLDGQLSLRADDARLELDVRAIDSAWVTGEQTEEMDARSLRLYDADGRALAVIDSAASPSGRSRCIPLRSGEERLWTTLMNALSS